MVEREKKNTNISYKERFQFVLSVNDNIICQRYFKINGFNKESICSLDLKDTLDEAVDMIKDDLKDKSIAYTYYTTPATRVKLTGFNGSGNSVTYLEVEPSMGEDDSNDPMLEPYEVTFKFDFMVDDRVVYSRIWDGSQYPKYVRNGVDITNSDAAYRDKDPEELGFNLMMIRRMTLGKEDLVYKIIQSICDVCSYDYSNEHMYQQTMEYGNKTYSAKP